jgi:hypothetical protein
VPKGFPGFQLNGAGLDCGDASFDFSGPGSFGVRIRRTIKAGQQFGSQFGPGVNVKAQGVSEDSLNGLCHTRDPTLGFAAQQALAADSGRCDPEPPRLKRRRSADD